jgi:hypothetical protein
VKSLKILWNWIVGLFIDEFEVTIYFPGEIEELEDGTKKEKYNPKNYTCRRVKIVSETEFRLYKTDGQLVRIKTVYPVGFDITKTR